MEREVWTQLVSLVRKVPCCLPNNRFTFSTADIVLIFLWSVLHDRPILWACRKENWPDDLRPARLPNPSTMTRRLRDSRCRSYLPSLHRTVRRRFRRGWINFVDGKPLPIANNSTDPDAGYGRGAGGMAKGYKLHVICGKQGEIRSWRVRPMQTCEHKVALELVGEAGIDGYLLADSYYDSNPLYEVCSHHRVQLVAPRRNGPHRGLGHIRQSLSRLRAMELLEHSTTGFGPDLMQRRRRIESVFGNLASASYGITALPAWVRRMHRVEKWVAAKILIFTLIHSTRKGAA